MQISSWLCATRVPQNTTINSYSIDSTKGILIIWFSTEMHVLVIILLKKKKIRLKIDI